MLTFDIYYIKPVHDTASAAILDAVQSWDGSWYFETNIQRLAGPNRNVFIPPGKKNMIAYIDGELVRFNCPIEYRRYEPRKATRPY